MQYWLFAHADYEGTVLIDKYDTREEAEIGRSKLDPNKYNYADIVKMEWQKEPKIVSSENFYYKKDNGCSELCL